MDEFWAATAVVVQTVCAVLALLLAGVQTAPTLRRVINRAFPRSRNHATRDLVTSPITEPSIDREHDHGQTPLPTPARWKLTLPLAWVAFFILLGTVLYARVAAIDLLYSRSFTAFYFYFLVAFLAVYLATRRAGAVGWLTPLLGLFVAAAAVAPFASNEPQWYMLHSFGPDCISLFAIALASRMPAGLAAMFVFGGSALLAVAVDEPAQVLACLIAAVVFGFSQRSPEVWMLAAIATATTVALEIYQSGERLSAWTRWPTPGDLLAVRWQSESFKHQWDTAAAFGPSVVRIDGHAELTIGWLPFLASVIGWVPALAVLLALVCVLILGVLVGASSFRTHPQVLAIALVPTVFLVVNLLIVSGVAPSYSITPAPYSAPASALWLAILVGSLRRPVFTERPIELAEPLRHPLAYFGFRRSRD